MSEDSVIVADGGDFVGSAAYILRYTANKRLVWNVDGNMIEQCLAAHIVECCQQYCSANVVTLDSGSTISLNIVDDYKQCWQKVIVQSC